jgi:hypothetical protein
MKLTQVEAARLMAAHAKVREACALWAQVEPGHRLFEQRGNAVQAAEQRFAELVAEYTDSEGL